MCSRQSMKVTFLCSTISNEQAHLKDCDDRLLVVGFDVDHHAVSRRLLLAVAKRNLSRLGSEVSVTNNIL